MGPETNKPKVSAAAERVQKAKSAAQEKEEKSIGMCREAIRCFSPELKEFLMRSLVGEDKASLDTALNDLKIDDETRRQLAEELRFRPGIPEKQKEQLIAKCFKGQVNKLRSLGLRALRVALGELNKNALGTALAVLVQHWKEAISASIYD